MKTTEDHINDDLADKLEEALADIKSLRLIALSGWTVAVIAILVGVFV